MDISLEKVISNYCFTKSKWHEGVQFLKINKLGCKTQFKFQKTWSLPGRKYFLTMSSFCCWSRPPMTRKFSDVINHRNFSNLRKSKHTCTCMFLINEMDAFLFLLMFVVFLSSHSTIFKLHVHCRDKTNKVSKGCTVLTADYHATVS